MARASASSVSFDDLIVFLQSKEDISTRIISVTSSDSSAPEAIRLAYSFPLVTKGDDGFIDQSGAFIAYA